MEDGLQERTLTLINYGEGNDEETLKTRITISPTMVQFLIASDETARMVDGLELRKVNIILVDGNNLEVFITVLDLTTLERSIGAYFLP